MNVNRRTAAVDVNDSDEKWQTNEQKRPILHFSAN